MADIKVGDKVHVGHRQKGGAGVSGTVTKIDGDRVHIKGHYDGKEYRGALEYAMKESAPYGEADHIMQTLADQDINSKVVGKTIHVHKDNVTKTKQIMKKLGNDHEVKAGLNEDNELHEEEAVTENQLDEARNRERNTHGWDPKHNYSQAKAKSIKRGSGDVHPIKLDGVPHYLDRHTGELYKATDLDPKKVKEESEQFEEEIDVEVFLDALDQVSDEVLEIVAEELEEATFDKRKFVVHYTPHGGSRKTRRTEEAWSPAGVVRKMEDAGHKIHDVTHNGESVMDEVRKVNSRRMNEEDLNELSSDLIRNYSNKAHAHLKDMKSKNSYGYFIVGSKSKHEPGESDHQRTQVNRNAGLRRAGAALDKNRRKERGLPPRQKPETKTRVSPTSDTKGYSMSGGGDGLGKNHGYGQGRYMGDSVEIEGVDAICEAVIIEGGVFFHANPVIKDKGHLLAVHQILASAGAAGRKSFSGTKLAQVTKKIHDTAGIGNGVWDHIHTSRSSTNESAFTFIKTFTEFVLESETQLDELSKYTLASYIGKASVDAYGHGLDGGLKIGQGGDPSKSKDAAGKRLAGIRAASFRLAKRADESEEFTI